MDGNGGLGWVRKRAGIFLAGKKWWGGRFGEVYGMGGESVFENLDRWMCYFKCAQCALGILFYFIFLFLFCALYWVQETETYKKK